MFRKQMKQTCRKCKGTGTSNKVALNRAGSPMIRDLYTKGDGNLPLYEDCSECHGEGRAIYDSPHEILVDGEKVKLDEEARRQRFDVVMS